MRGVYICIGNNRQTDRQRSRQTDKEADRQTDRHTDRQSYWNAVKTTEETCAKLFYITTRHTALQCHTLCYTLWYTNYNTR